MSTEKVWVPQRAAMRREMKKAGLNQAQFARELGIRPQHLSRVLNGVVAGRLELWEQMAETLGMTWQLVAVDPNAPLAAWVLDHLGITLEPWQAARLRGIVKDRS